MSDTPFSIRQGFRPDQPLVFDEATVAVRIGLREVLWQAGFQSPDAQRQVLCKAARRQPDPGNWSAPNVEQEVIDLVSGLPWFRFFDLVERLPRFFPADMRAVRRDGSSVYEETVNGLFAEERVGWRMAGGKLERLGTDEFHDSVEASRSALSHPSLEEPRRQFERALEFKNSRPADWSNATKEAVNSVEGVLQVLADQPGVSMSSLITSFVAPTAPTQIAKMLTSLFGLGSGTVGARHAAVEGIEATPARAELAIHLAAAFNAFLVSEHGSSLHGNMSDPSAGGT